MSLHHIITSLHVLLFPLTHIKQEKNQTYSRERLNITLRHCLPLLREGRQKVADLVPRLAVHQHALHHLSPVTFLM